ncbi:MAG: hypothetical protein WBA93_10095, partial [Microcoleaceae cyanobacterium]
MLINKSKLAIGIFRRLKVDNSRGEWHSPLQSYCHSPLQSYCHPSQTFHTPHTPHTPMLPDLISVGQTAVCPYNVKLSQVSYPTRLV